MNLRLCSVHSVDNLSARRRARIVVLNLMLMQIFVRFATTISVKMCALSVVPICQVLKPIAQNVVVPEVVWYVLPAIRSTILLSVKSVVQP